MQVCPTTTPPSSTASSATIPTRPPRSSTLPRTPPRHRCSWPPPSWPATSASSSEPAEHATTTRDRQLVALADAHLRGDADLLHVLVRDHLSEHPDNLLAAWIAGRPLPTQ